MLLRVTAQEVFYRKETAAWEKQIYMIAATEQQYAQKWKDSEAPTVE